MDAAAENRWRSRPLLAGALKGLVVLVPAAAAITVTALLNSGVTSPSSMVGKLGWWLLLLGVSTAVALLVERQTRRLLPLAVLFKLTLLFPDEAPSRYRIARAAGNPQRLRELASGSSPRSKAATHVLAWVAQLTKHDRHTRGHSERVRVFSDLIAEQMAVGGRDRDKLRWAALLHDIGKLQVPATVLNKAGKPSATEWDVLRQHPAAGIALVGPLAAWLGSWAGGIADHHERFDGTGYPRGLAGEQISTAGRIVAVADAYETMTANRSYKRAVAAATAREELARCAGTHFDPAVVRAFLAVGLPRILYGIGPLSFLVHLPFLARVPDAGLGLLAVAGQAAAPVAAGLTAASVATVAVVSPTAPTAPSSTVATSSTSKAASSSHQATTAQSGFLSIAGSLGTVARLTGTTPARAGSSASGTAHKSSAPRASAPKPSQPGNPKAANPKSSGAKTSSSGPSKPKTSNPKTSNPKTSSPKASTSTTTSGKPAKSSTTSRKSSTTSTSSTKTAKSTAPASASKPPHPKTSKH
jgi:hypothetical protein